jgi:NAD(P)-dependent dehydrogenase (short-subunit alcohol dehydrogenase family)
MTITGTPNTAIVTGGSKGFGRALAGELGRQGWAVIIDGRDAGAVHQAAIDIGAIAVPGDVTDPAHRDELLATALQTGGRLDLLVNNASTLGPSPLPSLRLYPLDALRHVFETNVLAPLALVQLALPFLATSAGAVLDITSDAAVEAYEGWGGYGSSKAALDQLSSVLAIEEVGIRVWSLDPGDMRTEMHQAAFPGQDISDRPEPGTVVPAVLALLRDRPPSGRVRASQLHAAEAP